ncbi:MAG: sulfate ABC transporter permease subunit [Anaerolineae bacterium]|nr:sulfate ABC transporter permease subunit [Anaerolineae bacterium]
MREITPRSPVGIALIVIMLGYAGLLLISPLVAILQGAFAKGITPFLNALTQPDVIHAFQVTFSLTFGAVVINTVFGLIVAWVLVRHRFPGKRIVDALVDAPFVFSPVIAGYVLIVLFGRGGWFEPQHFQIVFAWPAMLLGTVFVSLPFVIREVQPVLASLALEQEEAAYTLGSSPWTTFRRIVLPQIWRGLLYGIVLTIARALGEFGAVAVAGGAIERLTESATVFVFRASLDRNPIGAYSVSIVLCLLSVGILTVMSLLRRRAAR